MQSGIAQASSFWRSEGIDQQHLNELTGVNLQIADLPDGDLGWASWNTITLDIDAAGHGWSLGRGGVDLASVLAHEFGHLLGFDHDESHDVMASSLASGTRLAIELTNDSSDISAVGLIPASPLTLSDRGQFTTPSALLSSVASVNSNVESVDAGDDVTSVAGSDSVMCDMRRTPSEDRQSQALWNDLVDSVLAGDLSGVLD